MRLKSLAVAATMAATLTVAPMASAQETPTPPALILPGCLGSSETTAKMDGEVQAKDENGDPAWQTVCNGLDLSGLSSNGDENADPFAGPNIAAIVGTVLAAVVSLGIIGFNVYNQFIR